MLTDLIGFEWRYHARQASFAAAVTFFALLGFALSATGFGPENVAVNSPYLVAQSLGFLSLFSVFAVAIFASNAMLRDVEHRFHEIVLTTPINRFRYLVSRSTGAFLAALTAVGCTVAGMVAGTFVPWLAPGRVAAFDLGPYAWAFAVIAIPNVLFVTAVLFAVAAVTRSAIATYVGAVFIYVLYFVGAALTDSPLMAASTPGAESGALAAFLDPFALSGFFETTRYWTVAEKNVRYVPTAGTLLVNRAFWIGVAGAIWMLVYRAFSFRVVRRTKARQIESAPTASGRQFRALAAYSPVAPSAGRLRIWLAAWVSSTRQEIRALLGSVPFVLVLALWAAMAGSEVYASVFDGEYGSISYPATGLVIGALRQPLSLLGTILMIYYGAEVFWRERRYRLASILDATPAASSAVIAAKWTALVTLVLSLGATGIAVGAGMQLAAGYRTLEPGVYLALLVLTCLPLALLAAATLFVHALSPGKYAGMVFVLVFALFAQRAAMLGLEHPLWRFASAPRVRYTAMNGFGHDVGPFLWFMLFWTVVAGLLVLAAAGLWRHAGVGASDRIRLLVRRSTRTGRSIAAALLAVAVATGSWILFNTNVLNAATSSADVLDWRADYERTYVAFDEAPQPGITAVDVAVDFYPDERRYRIAGKFALVNATESEIATVLVAIRREARVVDVALASAQLAAKDVRFGMYRFEIDEPLAPGARTELTFDLEFASSGSIDLDPDDSVVANGSLLMSNRAFPSIGYRRTYEITDPRERQRRGLGASRVAELEGAHGEAEPADAQWVDFAATVSTSADQTALAPGRLVDRWERDGRRSFRYVSDTPMLNRFAFASARYEVASRRHRDRDIEVYFHPGHGANVERMLDAATESLDVFEEQFGAYPHGQLRIAEVPPYWEFGAFAMPAMIFVVENRAFLTDARDSDRLDLVTRRIAHEIAHQWWGHAVVPASAEGAAMLVESLTKYSEMLVLERRHGKAHIRRMLAIELDRYLAGRAREEGAVVPLYRTGNQAYLYYGKGALITGAIRDLIGDDAMRVALRGLIDGSSGPGGRATTLDLIAHLRRVASERDGALIEAWMKEIVLYDLSIEPASVTRRDDGWYGVTVRVSAASSVADGGGNEQPRELAESIDVAVFAVHPDDAGGAEPVLASQRVDLRTGITEVHFVVDRSPGYVAVDPALTRIDRNRLNNVAAVEELQSYAHGDTETHL